MKWFIALLLSIPTALGASTWYVRPTAQGAANGTSYADAWGNITTVNWTSVQENDTVYVAGTHIFTVTGVNQYINQQCHIGRNNVTIRGDYPGDPGTIFGGCVDGWHSVTWTGPDANGVYWSTNYYFYAYRRANFQVAGTNITYLPIRTNITWTDGGSGCFFDGVTNWVKLASGAPGTNVAAFDGGFMFDLNQKTNLTFQGLTFIGGGINRSGDGYHGSAGANYDDAPKWITWTNCNFLYQTGMPLWGGMDYWTFGGCEMAYGPYGPYSYYNQGNRGAHYLTVTGCNIHHTQVFPEEVPDLHGIGLQSVCNSVITHNWVHDCGGSAIDYYTGLDRMMTNNLCAWNLIQNISGVFNSGGGIVMDTGLPQTDGVQAGLVIKGNIIQNVGIGASYGRRGIGLANSDPVVIVGNTIVQSEQGIFLDSNNKPTQATILDNLIVNATNNCIAISGTGTPVINCDYNLFYNSGAASFSPSTTHDAHSVSANPLFVSASPTVATDFRLQAGSPARGAGTPSSDWTRDFANNPTLNPPSIGAYEYGASGNVGTARIGTLKGP